jgi:hypothetical protein
MVAAGRARLALSSVARREAPRSALQRSSSGSLEDAASFEEVRQDLRAIARFCHEQAELSPASSRAGLASALSRIGCARLLSHRGEHLPVPITGPGSRANPGPLPRRHGALSSDCARPVGHRKSGLAIRRMRGDDLGRQCGYLPR